MTSQDSEPGPVQPFRSENFRTAYTDETGSNARYGGNAIPSRSFRALQNMTDSGDTLHAAPPSPTLGRRSPNPALTQHHYGRDSPTSFAAPSHNDFKNTGRLCFCSWMVFLWKKTGLLEVIPYLQNGVVKFDAFRFYGKMWQNYAIHHQNKCAAFSVRFLPYELLSWLQSAYCGRLALGKNFAYRLLHVLGPQYSTYPLPPPAQYVSSPGISASQPRFSSSVSLIPGGGDQRKPQDYMDQSGPYNSQPNAYSNQGHGGHNPQQSHAYSGNNYVPPSQQQAVNPRQYSGGNIPSRIFRHVQAMTGEDRK